ncbi:MAG: hypothetical protein AB4372_10385 [Xenococcus sp. (in: cyanobacteria)]
MSKINTTQKLKPETGGSIALVGLNLAKGLPQYQTFELFLITAIAVILVTFGY